MRTEPSTVLHKEATREACLRNIFGDSFSSQHDRLKLALVGTFAPRKCGIATFTTDIFEKLSEFQPEIDIHVYAVDDPSRPENYRGIAGKISSHDRDTYSMAARDINESGADVVWLQHEFGIFGGQDGALVIDLIDRIAMPLIVTLHTVLPHPSGHQRSIIEHIISRASRLIVMSRHARDLLVGIYGAPQENIHIIEHGAPDRPFGREALFKEKLGLSDKKILMTFGLLSPGKGIELVIEAMPDIIRRHPDVVYRIVGATHPHLVAQHGEQYRDSLIALSKDLGVSDYILWENRFLDTEELLDQIEACDIYITPYLNMDQSTSGTLSYAFALGKAIISTPYIHAKELLDGGLGELINPNSAEEITEAVCALYENANRLRSLQFRAYTRGRETIWPRFADASAKLIGSVLSQEQHPVPITTAPALTALFAMSDATGMLQHSIGVVPDRAHGYCLDDNARALMLINVADGISREERMRWQSIYAAFVQSAWNPDRGRFRNFMRYDRSWCEDMGSDDSNGRALWALGHTVEHSCDRGIKSWAEKLYAQVLPHLRDIQSPRALAFGVLGACSMLRVHPQMVETRELIEYGAATLEYLLSAGRRPEWPWFEIVLGYDNPRLSQALIEAGSMLGNPVYLDAGIETLEWIAAQQTSAKGNFRPIGSETFGKPFTAMPFDQQPLEAQAAIDAARAAVAATGNAQYYDHAFSAWSWFFGANDRDVVLADMDTGRCRDGITPRGVNENCGAESILAFQLSHYAMMAFASIKAYRDSMGDEIESAKRHHHESISDTR